jgi:metal-responsive CopG/Arc/MetJ family transcriptional regulator
LLDAEMSIIISLKEGSMSDRRVRTTVAVAADLLEAVDAVVQKGKADSRNEFLEIALRNELAARRRAEIDAEFAQMAVDQDYQREALKIAKESKEFEAADWEALSLAEGAS